MPENATVCKYRLSSPQIRILQALAPSSPSSPGSNGESGHTRSLTREQICDAIGTRQLTSTLGPARDNPPADTLLGMGLVEASDILERGGRSLSLYSLTEEGLRVLASDPQPPGRGRKRKVQGEPVFDTTLEEDTDADTDMEPEPESEVEPEPDPEPVPVPVPAPKVKPIVLMVPKVETSTATTTVPALAPTPTSNPGESVLRLPGPAFPTWYVEYRQSPTFLALCQQVLAAWGGRCALSHDHVEPRVYHRRIYRVETRTEVFGSEEVHDCIPLCAWCYREVARQLPAIPD